MRRPCMSVNAAITVSTAPDSTSALNSSRLSTERNLSHCWVPSSSVERPRMARLFTGGTAGNAQLTALVATVLVVLVAIEGATLLNLSALLTVHAFVGMLLIPVIALKLASTGWRMLRYYRRAEAYVA